MGKSAFVCHVRRPTDHKVPLNPKFFAAMPLMVSGCSRGKKRNQLLNSKNENDLGQKQAVPHYQILFTDRPALPILLHLEKRYIFVCPK